MKARRAKKEKNKNLIMMVLITLFIGVIAVTGKGTYAYFTGGEKILPAASGGTPVYNQFTVNYTNHADNEVVKDGITVYFDIASDISIEPKFPALLTSTVNWNPPNSLVYMYFKNSAGSDVRNTTWESTKWESTTMALKFDSISDKTPTDLSKCYFSKSVNNIISYKNNEVGGITWTGCWLKYKIPNSICDLRTGEAHRYIIIHRYDGVKNDDQTADTMEVSADVKEVYIKAKAVTTDKNKVDWVKLEVKY